MGCVLHFAYSGEFLPFVEIGLDSHLVTINKSMANAVSDFAMAGGELGRDGLRNWWRTWVVPRF